MVAERTEAAGVSRRTSTRPRGQGFEWRRSRTLRHERSTDARVGGAPPKRQRPLLNASAVSSFDQITQSE